MKFTCNTPLLVTNIGVASHFTSSMLSSHPSLQGIYIQTKEQTLIIRSTNLNDFFETSIDIKTEMQGECIVDGKKFLEFISLLPDKEVSIELKDKNLVVLSGKTKGVFTTYIKGDYPDPPSITIPLRVFPQLLLEQLPFIVFATAKDDARPVLTGILCKQIENKTHIVSTDGFRLSLLVYDEVLVEGECIIPARVLSEVLSLSKESKEVKFAYDDDHSCIIFSFDNHVITSRVIEGEFPPYNRVVPEGFKTRCVVHKQEMVKNVKLASIFARELSNIIILDITPKEILLRSKGTGPDVPHTQVEVTKFEGDMVKIAFNYRFVLDMLAAISTDEVIIELSGGIAPVVFKSPAEGQQNKLHVIMPLRTEETE